MPYSSNTVPTVTMYRKFKSVPQEVHVLYVTMIAYHDQHSMGRVRSEVRGQGSLNSNFTDKHWMASASCTVNRKKVVSTNQDIGQTFQ